MTDAPNLSARAKLAAWLRERGIKAGAFGALIPVKKDRISVILGGKRLPRQHEAGRIEQLTGGFVRASEWGIR